MFIFLTGPYNAIKIMMPEISHSPLITPPLPSPKSGTVQGTFSSFAGAARMLALTQASVPSQRMSAGGYNRPFLERRLRRHECCRLSPFQLKFDKVCISPFLKSRLSELCFKYCAIFWKLVYWIIITRDYIPYTMKTMTTVAAWIMIRIKCNEIIFIRMFIMMLIVLVTS